MELWLPENIALDDISRALMSDVDGVARTVNEFRPLPPHLVQQIEQQLLGERVYSSNAIEGNTLELRETIQILQTGAIAPTPRREALEALNLGKAVDKVSEWVRAQESAHTLEKFLSLHRILLQGIDDDHAGRYRTERVMIAGATYQPPDQSRIPSFMEQVLNRLSQETSTHPLLLATWAHWAITRTHPFFDGNGRMARLWQDLILFQGKLTCAIIRPQDRREYLDALGEADEKDFNPLLQLVAQRVSLTFDQYVKKLGEEEQLSQWARELGGEVEQRVQEERRLTYIRWSRKMERLRSEFELCVARLSEASSDVSIQLRPYDLVDQGRWESLRAGIGASKTWFFTVFFSRREQHWRYYFFFGKHFCTNLYDEQDRAEQRVCLLLSEAEGTEEPKRPDESTATPVTLREVFLVRDGFVRKRFDLEKQEDVYDRDVLPLQIAKEFLSEVMLQRLT